MGSVLIALQIANALAPEIKSLILTIAHTDGSKSAIVYLDEADAQFAANQQQIQAWLASKGKTPAV